MLRIVIREADGPSDVERCRELAGRVHGLAPGEAPVGGWPTRWLMALGEGRLVATVGLAGREGCVHWFYGPHAFPLAAAPRAAGASELTELRMLAVEPAMRGFSFARLLGAAAYSRGFLAPGGEPVAVLHCARRPLFRVLERGLGVRTRLVASLGEGARASELRLLLPDADVPPGLREQPLPAELRRPSQGPGTPVPRVRARGA